MLGGAGLALFGSVAASGIRTLSKVNYDGNNNLVIVAVSIAFGVLPSLLPPIPGYIPGGFWGQFPHGIGLVLESGISSAAIVAFLLNLFFNVLGGGDSGCLLYTSRLPGAHHGRDGEVLARAAPAGEVPDDVLHGRLLTTPG